MRDHLAFRPTAIRYWERRRIIYNLALLLASFFSFALADVMNWAGDEHDTQYSYVLELFALSALGANICYSFAYALEFLFGSDHPTSSWMRYGRTVAFVGGVAFALLLALIGGREIAGMAYDHQFDHLHQKRKAARLILEPQAKVTLLAVDTGAYADYAIRHSIRLASSVH